MSADANSYDEHGEALARLKPGGSFILDAPERVPCIWGDGDQVAWAEGEALTICGPPGAGKTTLVGQLVRARILGEHVLGMPVQRTEGRVLYLAMDRPQQISRALRRTLGDVDREVLDRHLVVWPGPPPMDVAKHPEVLIGLAQHAEADTVIVDSLKDAAVGLVEDEVGAGYNRARQMCIANGVQVVELHHMKKRGNGGDRPTTLADLYGSVWISAGSGSVVLLWGAAGDPIVEWHHLKQPAAEVGPFKVLHDHDTGTSSVFHTTDLLALAKAAGGDGITAKDAAVALFATDKPKANEVEKARRRLDRLTKGGHLAFTEGDRSTSTAAVWTFTEPFTHPSEPGPLHETPDPSRTPRNQGEKTFTEPFTTFTEGDLHARPLPFKGGASESLCPRHGTDLAPDRCATCEDLTKGMTR